MRFLFNRSTDGIIGCLSYYPTNAQKQQWIQKDKNNPKLRIQKICGKTSGSIK